MGRLNRRFHECFPPQHAQHFSQAAGRIALASFHSREPSTKCTPQCSCEREPSQENPTPITCYENALLTSEAVFGNRTDVARILLAILRARGPRAGDWAMRSRA